MKRAWSKYVFGNSWKCSQQDFNHIYDRINDYMVIIDRYLNTVNVFLYRKLFTNKRVVYVYFFDKLQIVKFHFRYK